MQSQAEATETRGDADVEHLNTEAGEQDNAASTGDAKAEEVGGDKAGEQAQDQVVGARAAHGVRTRKYLTVSQIKALPEPEWLLKGLLPAGSLSVLFGPPKLGKSFIALDWSLCIAHGLKWVERATPAHAGPVLYVAGEGTGGIGRRIKAWEKHYDKEAEDGRIAFPDLVVNLYDSHDSTQFLRELNDNFDPLPSLVVVDTLSRAMIGAEENSAGDMNRAIANADRIRQTTGAALLAIHHTTKADARVERGSTALRGGADVMLRLEERKKSRSVRNLVVDSARDFEEGLKMKLRFAKVLESGLLVPDDGHDEGDELSPQQQRLVDVLGDFDLERGASSGEWREASEPEIKERRFYELAAQLVTDGYVKKSGTGTATRYRLTFDGLPVMKVQVSASPATQQVKEVTAVAVR
jgi:AAA domain-containing protein